MKKVLFIDRDGTLIKEPPEDYQIDSLEKLSYIPYMFQSLSKIANCLDYEFVMVSNQDGLGTASFPEITFWTPHNKLMEAMEGEGIRFSDIIIDRTFPDDNMPTRKPGTALLSKYINGSYDLKNSFVIGDRESDIFLAKNLGAKSIWINSGLHDISEEAHSCCTYKTNDWRELAEFLMRQNRKAIVVRNTKETKITAEVCIDGNSFSDVSTGIGFFDHLIDQLARHSGMDIMLKAEGDLHVDEHHTIEDTALVLGEALREALGRKTGINRYAFVLPMDDAQVSVALDLGGRYYLDWNVSFAAEKIGNFPTQLAVHFFRSFAEAAKCNLHISASGHDDHHKLEAIFKAMAKVLKSAAQRDIANTKLPSTKGIL